MPESHPWNSELIGLWYCLGFESLKTSPGDSDLQLWLRTPAVSEVCSGFLVVKPRRQHRDTEKRALYPPYFGSGNEPYATPGVSLSISLCVWYEHSTFWGVYLHQWNQRLGWFCSLHISLHLFVIVVISNVHTWSISDSFWGSQSFWMANEPGFCTRLLKHNYVYVCVTRWGHWYLTSASTSCYSLSKPLKFSESHFSYPVGCCKDCK